MTLRTLSLLALASVLVTGCNESTPPVLSAQKPIEPSALVIAVNKALVEGDTAAAVTLAQLQAQVQPNVLEVQRALARAQLADGRYADALYGLKPQIEANPQDTALSFSYGLALLATGQAEAGRVHLVRLVMTGAPQMASDAGLALALGGDPDGGLSLLEPAARAPGADGRVRQNLGLAYAAKGDWLRARDAARLDLTPEQVDAALTRWAALLQHQTPERIAILLGAVPERLAARTQLVKAAPATITPVASLGIAAAANLQEPVETPVQPAEKAATTVSQLGPVQLAAATPLAVEPARVAPAKAEQAVVEQAKLEPAKVEPAKVEPAKIASKPAAMQTPKVVRLAAHQASANVVKASAPARALRAVPEGTWSVQLGAFSTVDLAKTAWGLLTGKFKILNGTGSPLLLRTQGTNLTRVVVSGFSGKSEAKAFCATYRASGGACFERRVTAAFSTTSL